MRVGFEIETVVANNPVFSKNERAAILNYLIGESNGEEIREWIENSPYREFIVENAERVGHETSSGQPSS